MVLRGEDACGKTAVVLGRRRLGRASASRFDPRSSCSSQASRAALAAAASVEGGGWLGGGGATSALAVGGWAAAAGVPVAQPWDGIPSGEAKPRPGEAARCFHLLHAQGTPSGAPGGNR